MYFKMRMLPSSHYPVNSAPIGKNRMASLRGGKVYCFVSCVRGSRSPRCCAGYGQGLLPRISCNSKIQYGRKSGQCRNKNVGRATTTTVEIIRALGQQEIRLRLWLPSGTPSHAWHGISGCIRRQRCRWLRRDYIGQGPQGYGNWSKII